MPIIKKSEPMPARPVIVLIYGEPGTGKTSLFNTCKNPLLLDFDRGSDRAHDKVDTLVITTGYKEVLNEEEAGSFKGYQTIGIDTPKALLDDFLMVYVGEQDSKLRFNKLKAYGAIGDEFKLFINKRRAEGADIFMVIHAATDKDGDNTKYYPDVTGGSLQLLKRIADQVGYMHMDATGKRVIDFRPSNSIVGKDVANIGTLNIPSTDAADYAGFADREIVQKVKDALGKMNNDQLEALKLIDDYRAKIDTVVPSHETLTALLAEIRGLETHISKQLIPYFTANNKKIGWKFDKEGTKTFVPVEAKKTETAKPAEQAPAAEETPAAEQAASEGNVDLFREQSKA